MIKRSIMAPDDVVHVFLISFPGQGHVNPLLRLGKRLASKGLAVTFCTPESWGKQMRKASGHDDDEDIGLIRFECFSDGWDDDDDEADARRHNLDLYLPQLEEAGKKYLPSIISKQKPPVSCLINNPFIPWVSDLAQSLSIPSALLWVQSCASFSAYYHYYHKLLPFPSQTQPHIDVHLPCMPFFTYDQIPTFLYPTTPYPFLRRAIMKQFQYLHKPFCVLMDTVLEMEQDNVEYMMRSININIKTVGPLCMAPAEGSSSSSSSRVRGDLLKPDDCCIEWLNSKPPCSVVYISFGSVVYLKQEQVDEIAYGLLESGVCFLWVMKPHKDKKYLIIPDDSLINNKGKGKIVVGWSPQEEVLSHPSVACFVTHCGWNSSMEAITSGVPIVAFPQWGDQVTNAKYLVDVYGVGIRMCRGESDELITRRDHVTKCLLEATVGDKASEIKKNVMKFKAIAEAAVAKSGSSHNNIEAFVDQIRKEKINMHARGGSIDRETN